MALYAIRDNLKQRSQVPAGHVLPQLSSSSSSPAYAHGLWQACGPGIAHGAGRVSIYVSVVGKKCIKMPSTDPCTALAGLSHI